LGIYLNAIGLEITNVDKYKKEQMKNNMQKKEISSRIQVLCSDLRDFRADFIRGEVVFGSCRASNIPDKFKPKDKELPNNLECRLRISFGINQHKFHLWNDQETYDWKINNTGLEDYINMLGDIWPEGGYSWLTQKPETIEFLNNKSGSIYESADKLLEEREYRVVATKVKKIVRCNGGQWTDRSSVNWSYPDEIEDIVKELESAVAQEPAEIEQKATTSLCRRIWTFIKRIPHWIYYFVGFLAALLTIFHYLGWI